jgi:site-specific recombinase XerD
MANIGLKNGIYHVRFRFGGREHKKSLKINQRSAALAAKNLVELTIHRLMTGQLAVPVDVDPGDFILSGGTARPLSPEANSVRRLPTTRTLIEEYKASQKNRLAESYHYSQSMHLRHFIRYLGELADKPGDRVTHRDLGRYLETRLAERHPNTAERERITLMQFYKWCKALGYLSSSPATGLAPIKAGADRPPFRTTTEIERIIARGGLTKQEELELWECLYPKEIASLLETIKLNAQNELSFILHALPAYTGMRRGEILRLRWLDIDLDENQITARSRKQSRTKTETVRRIDMHSGRWTPKAGQEKGR